MLLVSLIWFCGIAEGIKTTLIIIGVIMLIATAIITAFIVAGDLPDDITLDFKRTIKKYIIYSISLISIGIIIPNEKTSYLMLSAYMGQKVITSEEVNIKLDKLSKVIDLKLDEYLKSK